MFRHQPFKCGLNYIFKYSLISFFVHNVFQSLLFSNEPVVGEHELQPGVVGSLDDDQVRAEVGAEEEGKGANDVGFLRLAS